ncbi:MAG TPA: malto-oligosyltrehalose synthase [Thermohalobaculum sp.]|nr:malto-oligosyltrehalose synthase [Thermohalobaculum sp.]
MSPPRATYRLQFRQDMDFERAAGLVPYLARLGVSHLYASPLFQAVTGSTHGYDVTDHGRMDASLGGMAGFERLSGALEAAGLGLILDIVPNHMAASPENPWWRDVLRHGMASRHAGHFDIDWSAPRLVLPVLGQPYGKALEAGELALGHAQDGLVLRYFEHAFPLDPRSWGLVLDPAQMQPPQAPEGFARWIGEPANAGRLGDRLEAISRDRALLHRVHEAQSWQLAYWRAGRDALSYRRFFEITGLVGVRVEDEGVFADVHRFVLALIEAGQVQGLRIDHVDGLADPAGYLARLRAAAPGTPVWVEKILAPDETLPDGWPVAGTTGYEFARLAGGVLTDPGGAGAIAAAYHDFIGAQPDPEAMLAEAKREILTWNLAAELDALTRLAGAAAADDPLARDWGADTLRRALVALACAMPVYRTYLTGGAGGETDAAVLARVERAARASAGLEDPAAVSDVLRLIRAGAGAAAARLRLRFQQTTGALMAKAMEDTLFYRFNRLVSANEVGGEPEPIGLDPDVFQRAVAARQPHALNATATHDTKRGEDARMRIASIADAPGDWRAAVAGWDARLAGAQAPDAEMRWLFYQALLGAWASDPPGALAERMEAYMLKAAREAKRQTGWTRPDAGYEARLAGFVERALGDADFRRAFEAGARPFIAAGARKSLVQLALKLVLPGVPDIYQGTEWADLSLVDPDNRRPVDFAARQAALDGPGAEGFDGAKMALMRRLLAQRRETPGLFARGACRALAVEAAGGRHLGAARAAGGDVLLVLAELSAPPARRAGGPRFRLPPEWQGIAFRTLWPDTALEVGGGAVAPGDGFAGAPVVVALGRAPG